MAKGRTVPGRVVRRVAVAGGQDHACGSYGTKSIVGPTRRTDEALCPVTPGALPSVPPAPIRQMEDAPSMRTGADLATSLGSLEADHGREMRPVGGVDEAVLAPDPLRLPRCGGGPGGTR